MSPEKQIVKALGKIGIRVTKIRSEMDNSYKAPVSLIIEGFYFTKEDDKDV